MKKNFFIWFIIFNYIFYFARTILSFQHVDKLKIAFFFHSFNGVSALLLIHIISLPELIALPFLLAFRKIGFLLFYITLFITLLLELFNIFFMTSTILLKLTNSTILPKIWQYRFSEVTFFIFNILIFLFMEYYRKKYVGPLFKKTIPSLKKK